jgi:hypothetical protein
MSEQDQNRKTHPLSLLSPRGWYQLFFKPVEFFSSSHWRDRSTLVLPLILITGIAAAINRVAKKIISTELGQGSSRLWGESSHIMTSWSFYWLIVIAIGIILAIVLWYLGGWWYQKRLQWSGAATVSSNDARRAYVYQDFVVSAPIILLAIVQTLLYANYREAWQGSEFLALSVIVFALWSCWTSYMAASTAFPVIRQRAKLWFLALPAGGYVVSMGLIGWLYSRFGS